MYVCRNLNSLWFHSTGLSFSPFQNSALNYVLATSTLVYVSTFRIFLHWISNEYCVEDSPVSWSCLVLHVWDSVPNWSDDGSISCLVWFPWWLRHGAMDPLERTHLGECWQSMTELTSEFTHFNPGIRLGKGKHSSFFRVSPRRCRLLNSCPLSLGLTFSGLAATDRRGNLLFQRCSNNGSQSLQCTWFQGTGHAFRCGTTSFWLSRWGKPVVHLIREDSKAVTCPIWVDRPRSLRGNNARLCWFMMELNPFLWFWFLFSSTRPPLVP